MQESKKNNANPVEQKNKKMKGLVMEEVNLEHIDILARRKVNIDYYNWYFLKLDIREHIAQLRVQKENKKKKTLNRQNLIKQMQELCSILHEEYQKLNEEADKRNVFSEELFKEDRYYFLLAKKFFLSRKILKELKQKESEKITLEF